nr:unnamed protein product [Digitaria exilis]
MKGVAKMQPETTKKAADGLTSPVDRLSALPDTLLHTILSFLPAPQVVQTCLLSQRWRHLWRSAPCIKINQQDFGISMRSLMTHTALDEKWARFEDFATNLLLFHDNTSSLDEFLVFAHVYNQRHVDRWIRRGIEYCPAVLRILMPGTDLAFKLPPMASSSFHRLKRLCLQNVDLDGQFTHLLSTFPVMEYLELTLCEFTGDCSQGITLSTLKKLVMLNEDSDEFPIFHNMQTLDLHSCFRDQYELYDKLEALGSFLQSTPCLEKLVLQYCMFCSYPDSPWEIERENITLHHQYGKIFQCQKLKLIEVIYDHDHDHQLIELAWRLGRRLPDASIKLKKIEMVST